MAIAATAQEARHFDFCGTYAFSEWTNFNGVPPDGGGFAFGSTDPITGAGCRASTTTAEEDTSNAIWLYENQERDDEEEDGEEEYLDDYSVEVTGRPELTGEAGGWAVLLRAHGFNEQCFGNCDDNEAYACTVNTFDCTLTLSLGLTSGVGLTSGEDRYDLASTEITDCADEAASPELWVLYGFAVGEELGCEVKIPSGARFSVASDDSTYATGAAGISGVGVGHTFRNVSIVDAYTPFMVDWKIPMDPQTLSVSAGTTVTFTWSSTHNVHEVPGATAFDNCDFSSGTEVASTAVQTVDVAAPDTPTIRYFVCTVGSHCTSGQKIAITWVATPTPAPIDYCGATPSYTIDGVGDMVADHYAGSQQSPIVLKSGCPVSVRIAAGEHAFLRVSGFNETFEGRHPRLQWTWDGKGERRRTAS